MNKLNQVLRIAALLPALWVAGASADVTISGTRVVYPLGEKEVTVEVNNEDTRPALVQAWIDDGNSSAEAGSSKVPFFITPAVFRMKAQTSQMLRIFYTRHSLPADRESVFWLNVLNVSPSVASDQSLQLALRTRIKVFARPEGLAGSAADAPARLSWRAGQQAVTVSNPTPYYVSFSEVSVESGGRTYRNDNGGMVAPRATLELPVPGIGKTTTGGEVHYKAIGDGGAVLAGDAPLGR